MESTPIESLSTQQRECLRLVWQQHSSKEIAQRLGISKNTVDGYIAEAVARLGARDRRHASRICFGDRPPDPVGGDTARVASTAAAAPGDAGPEGAATPFRLPFRRKGAARNDLSILERLAWIPLLGIVVAIGFGMLAVGLRSLGDIVLLVGQLVHGR